jgi:hypothetical protein
VLEVVDEADAPVRLVAIDWTWSRGPGRFAPTSRFWHDPQGRYAVIVPEGASAATVSVPGGTPGAGSGAAPVAASVTVAETDLVDGAVLRLRLAPP